MQVSITRSLEKTLPYLLVDFPTAHVIFIKLTTIHGIVGGSKAPSYSRVIVGEHCVIQLANPFPYEIIKNPLNVFKD